jgi:hypothetical protein
MSGRVAQLVEQCPFKAWVAGSNPAALTMISKPLHQLQRVAAGHRQAPRKLAISNPSPVRFEIGKPRQSRLRFSLSVLWKLQRKHHSDDLLVGFLLIGRDRLCVEFEGYLWSGVPEL